MTRPAGCFALVLHAHLPYVLGHGTWPHGSRMLYDAATGTYIPLLWTLRKLVDEGVRPGITMSFSPVLMEQLADDRFREWYAADLDERIRLATENEREFEGSGDGHKAWLARCWRDRLAGVLETFEGLGRDILGGYRELYHAGQIELITSAATHGYLPLLHEDGSVQLQVKQGLASFARHIGNPPRGLWLPECAYRPHCRWAPRAEVAGGRLPWPRKGLEEYLAADGINFFFVDTHMFSGMVARADVRWEGEPGRSFGRIRSLLEPMSYEGLRTPYAPYLVASVDGLPAVASLVRDPATGLRVWSGDLGYPGDFDYLEFHKKHTPGDLRYWRVTDAARDLSTKAPYDPYRAESKTREHAANFLEVVKEALGAAPRMDRRPVLCAPFDAELMGHWWYEGPVWLEHVLRGMSRDPDLAVVTCSEYLEQDPPDLVLAVPEGSWGMGGGHWVWENRETDWTWQRVWDAELDYAALLRDHGYGHDDSSRALIAQAGRELLLLQASDWQFLITLGGAADYASARLGAHHSDYKRLADTARRYCRGEMVKQEDWAHLAECQDRDRLFPDLDPQWFGKLDRPAV